MSGLKELHQKLSMLQQPNANLQDVHILPGLSSRIDAIFWKLGLSDYLSDSEDSADDGDGKQDGRKERGKKLQSGKTAKITSHPCFSPCLTLAKFAARYVSILCLPSLSLPSVLYVILPCLCTWQRVNFHGRQSSCSDIV